LSDRDLILKTASLARMAPKEWSDFLAAFKSYTDQRRDQCVSSPVDTILVSQGRAQQCASLLRLFDECMTTADQIQDKRK
jgi:hypothetical protein